MLFFLHSRNEIDNLKNELFDVKESYIALVNENKELENQVRGQCEEDAFHRLNEVRFLISMNSIYFTIYG